MITGAEIKEARDKLKETPSQFAYRIGIARTTLLNWENGNLPKTGPSQALAERVLAELSVQRAETSV